MAGSVVKATLTADARQFQAGFKKAENATQGFDKKISKTADLAKGFLAGAAATAVVGFARDAVAAFSSVEQSAGSVESVFGEAADKITSQAEGAAEAFGLSASEFQSSAALIGSMLKNQLGLSADEAADKVDDLTGKAADMAATFGGTTSDAISAIGSLMRGERDPIEKYGVSMSDASIQAYALEKGLAASTDEMTPQIKATAALDLLFEQTADSAGQFARETDTLAGQQQILTAKVENAKAAIGEELAPAVQAAMGAMDVLIPVVESLTSALGGAAEATQPLIDELTTLIGIAPESGIGLESVGSALATTILPFLAPVIGGLANINELLGTNDKANRDAVRAMEDTRTHGVQPLTEATEDLVDATRDSTDAFYDHQDAVRASTDPVFALAEAERDQAEAITAAKDAAAEYGRGSPEHLEALGAVKDAAYDVQDAEKAMGTQSGTTRATMETHLRSLAVYTEGQIQLMLDEFDRINAYSFQAKTISVTHKVTGGGVQEYQTGGVVPGPTGSPQMAIVHGGEEVIPAHRAGRGGSGTVNNITIHAGLGSDPNAISRALVEALQRYDRSTGPIPIRTRTA